MNEINPWSPAEEAELERLWAIHGGRMGRIAKIMDRTPGSISGKSRNLGLQFHGGRSITLDAQHPVVRAGVTMFPSRVAQPVAGVLKSGNNQRKLGTVVKKGHWRGFALYSLTLEERRTCPRSCALWTRCYGNGMGHAIRYVHGRALERRLATELPSLQDRHPGGFVVRLHILGDFYSVEYVDFWRSQLALYPSLHIFGYTARQAGDPIGDAIADLRRDQWARFAVRTSGATSGPRALVVEKADQAAGAIICPAQTGKTSNCSTCGICWSTTKPIAFLRH